MYICAYIVCRKQFYLKYIIKASAEIFRSMLCLISCRLFEMNSFQEYNAKESL